MQRSNGRCEFCGKSLDDYFDLHHRWYPSRDTLRNLMVVHAWCHKQIHFGGHAKVAAGSLAAIGDDGNGNSPLWRDYLRKVNS